MKSDKLYTTKKKKNVITTKEKLATIVERQCKDMCSNQKYENYQEKL